MPLDLSTFLSTIALVLCTAAITTVVFQRLKQPVILGYLLAGLLVGPHVTLLPFVANEEATHILAELGIILLLFGIGLEFSLRKLIRVGGSAAITGVIAISMIFFMGNAAARLLGWNATEALFAGAAIAVSSTTIIAKAFEDRKIGGRLRELVFSVLIVEDLVSILMLAGLTTVAAGQAASAGALAFSAFRLLGLLTVATVVGLLVIPRAMRWVVSLKNNETILVASVGLCFGGAWMAYATGYSVAIGAFLAGSLIAESGEGHTIELLVIPVRDVFAAIFFVSVGMLIDPALVVEHWQAVLLFTVLVVVGKVFAVSIGAFFSGAGVRVSVKAGMSMAQIGEFSFIIAAVGATSPQVSEFLYPVMVAVSAATTMITPWLIGASPAAAAYIDRKLPRPLQTFAALYETWIENLGAAPRQSTMGQRVRRLVGWLVVDAAVITAILIGATLTIQRITTAVTPLWPWDPTYVRTALIMATGLMILPFVFGIIRVARRLADKLAEAALPRGERLDHAAAPRGVFTWAVEILIVVLVGFPVLAITQPFLPPFTGAVGLVILLMGLATMAWRSMTNLEGHVTAGGAVLLSAISKAMPAEKHDQQKHEKHEEHEKHVDRLSVATQLLPGMGKPQRFVVEEGHFGAGKSLLLLGLRGRTGATVLGITRGGQGIPAPSKTEVLQVGDQLVLVGSRVAVEAAKSLLLTGELPND
jgi:CPA2 family monovalent cation:H+ antiporter-2